MDLSYADATMKLHRIAPEEHFQFQQGIVAIEQAVLYPLVDDFFQIDHGNDYFAFFDRLGVVDFQGDRDHKTLRLLNSPNE